MPAKTPGDEHLHKTWKKTGILLVLAIFSAMFLSAPADAFHTGTSVVVFTDKRAYNPFSIDLGKGGGTPAYKADFTSDFSIYVYAIVLDEKGLIMKGREGQLTGTLVDQKEYRHTSDTQHIGATVDNPGIVGTKTLTFKDDGTTNGDIASDGIYVAVVDMPENIGQTMAAPTDELLINITVTDPQAGSAYTDVLIAGFNCMSASSDYTNSNRFSAHDNNAAPNPSPPYAISDNCVVCHRGYEHFFENISGAIDYKYLDAHFKNATARSRVPNPLHSDVKAAKDWDLKFNWNKSDYNGAYSARTLDQMAPGSKFCYFCHTYNLTTALMKYEGAGAAERDDLTKIPSCNNSNCHTTTKINKTATPAWSPVAAAGSASLSSPSYNVSKAEKHAHDSTGKDTVPCASCHGNVHGLQIPNGTSTDYQDLALRCLSCHQLFNKHNSSVSCIKCHGNDTHNIRFLQQDLSYNWSTTNVVTCDNCHTNASFAPSLGLSPPQVPYTNHSGDSDAGQKWGDYWTSDNQQAAVGGSNLIQTSTVVVSSESVQYGTASPLSGAQTMEGSYETLTEGTKSVASVDYYTYVDSNSTPYGTVANWNNIKNASDGTAFANFTEVLSGAGNGTYYGSNTKSAGGTTDAANVALIDDSNATLYATGDSVSAGIWGNGDVGIGSISSVNLFARLALTAGNEYHKINYDIEGVAGSTDPNVAPPATGVLTSYSRNVTTDRSWKWDDMMKMNITVLMTQSGGDGGDIVVDAIWVQVNYTSARGLASTMLFSGTPVSDKYYLEMNYKTAGDTYDIYVFDGKNWTDRGNLTAAAFTVFNITLSDAEYSSGSPQVLIRDKNATATVGNISIDYMRIHGWTADTSHQELNLNHNFTGITKYAAQETAEYTLIVKGYVNAGENLDIYVYDNGSYLLIKDNAFPTSNGWVNYSLPYTAISDTGTANIQFRDNNKTRYDNVQDNFFLDYVAIKADNYKYLPCYYCHALLANHKKRALGNIEWVQTGATEQNLMNSTNLSGNWCANCHYNGSTPSGKYKYNGSAWSPAPPLITVNNINPSNPNYGSWYDHSSIVATNFTDAKCKECHGTAAIQTTKQFPHSVEIGSSGGANCTNCHNIGGSAGTGRLVNFTAMNDTNAIHKNLNTGASTSLPAVNKKCWACHGNGSEPGSGHPTNYKTPHTCTSCHLSGTGQNLNFTPQSILNVTQHYWNGSNITTASATSCYACHNRSEMMVGVNLDPDGAASVYSGANGGSNSTSHYGLKRSNLGGYAQDTAGYCSYCHNTTTNNATFYVNDFNNTIFNHSARASTPLCTNCHNTGRIHNSTLAKPVSNDSYCSTCHGAGGSAATKDKLRHKALNCTECHANNSVGTLAGKDIHAIKYITQSNTFATSNTSAVNCVTCHQTTSVDSSLGSFSPFKIVSPMKHSNNVSNGSVWDGYWTNTNPQTACIYCHNNTLHNTTPLGRILQWNQNYQMYGGISATNSSCGDCHYKGDSNYTQMNSSFTSAGLKIPPEISNGTNWKGNSSNYYNHSLDTYYDQDCKNCHGSLLSGSANMSEFLHNAAIGVAGGANCTACHNIGGTAGSGKLVNFSAINDSNALHKNLNSGATNSSNAAAENKKCWACHGNGSEPGSGHPTNYKTPYTCTSCHLSGTGQNLNFTPQSILNVTQHYWNGSNITTASATSCYACHNRSEMMVGLTLDPDGAGTGVYSGANGGSNSTSHYGKKRNDMAGMANLTYCNYCHNNGTTVFPFINNSNKTIANHSVNYSATNPGCPDCHSSGRIHNSTLYKPAFALPNSSYCISCHGSGGSATIKGFEQHNGTSGLNCTNCHLNSTDSIHPVRYLQQGGSTWNTSKTNAVNCTTCHQGSGIGGFASAPKVPAPMNHSTNRYNGSLWNSTPGYWTNTSQQSSCDYCHGKIALHNTSGLGNMTRAQGTNTVRQNLNTSRWCANCHYSGAAGYAGTLFSPEPPEITNATGKVPAKALDNTNFYNHSQDMVTGYNDSKCKNCHDNALDAGATSLNFSHNVAQGGGGANCTSCHNIGAGVQNINVTAINDANAIHKDLNKGATASDSGFNDSKKCWACHSGDGKEPSGHPTKYKTPYNCTDCHVQGAGQNFNYTPNSTILNVTQHYWNGSNITTANATSCYACHNTSGMITMAYDPDGASINVYNGANGGNLSVSHYGVKRSDMAVQQNTTPYCDNCHNGASAFPFIDSANRTIANHSANYPATNPTCNDCHSGGRIHNSTLIKKSLNPLPNATYCTGCHGTGGSASKNNLERHNSTGTSCSQCHMNASSSIHPVRYLQQDNTWATTKASAVNCTSCHQGSGMSGFGSAPKVPQLNHSTNKYSGALWNGTQLSFWDNTSQQSGCDYCHGRIAFHNLSGLGNLTRMKGNNTVKQGLNNGYWCANCHYNTTPAGNYSFKGNLFSPEPPEVLNRSGKVPSLARDSTQFYNHSNDLASSYDDAKCKTCHDNNLGAGATSLNFTHSLSSSSGGANCTNCHGLSGSLSDGKRINQTAMNSSIHKDLNKDAPASDANYSESKKCWACHGNGQEPGGHPTNYKNPYNCTNCHVQDAGQNLNFTPVSILNVTQHFWNGTSINTSAVTSCYTCHNKSEMMVGMALDPDGASSNVYSGANGGNQSTSHYGKKRTDMAAMSNTTYCNYCHNNQSSVFPFIDSNNMTTLNHSINYPASNPSCADCHASGRLHNSTLYKPAFDLSNVTYCLSCHGNNGSGGTNYTGAVTSYREKHNNSLCTGCHVNSTRSIHPVRYLQQNNTWGTTNNSAVNCTSCHQGAGMPNFSTAFIVETPTLHSNNTYSGALWNGTQQPRYWDNTSQLSSCYYCHGKSALHNSSGLGNAGLVQGGNSLNQSLTGSYWCANCHYNGSVPSGNYNYKGNLLSPIPPEVLNLTGLVPANSSSNTPFQNHSTNIAGDWSDARCKSCHGKELPANTTSATFVHKLNQSQPDAGGPDCLNCHASTAPTGPDRPPLDKRLNASAFTNYSVHKDLNKNAINSTPLSYNGSKACWACHSDGTQPIKHPADYLSPKPCEYCHLSGTFSAPIVGKHYPGSIFSGQKKHSTNFTAGSCQVCHNNSIVYNNITFKLNTTVSHYAGNKSYTLYDSANANSCLYCHNSSTTLYGVPTQIPNPAKHSMGGVCQALCHNPNYVNSTTVNPVILHNASLGIIYSCFVAGGNGGCHVPRIR